MKILVIAMALPGLLFADFRYEQTTKITKGMAMNVPFAKKPEPVTTTHYFKGGRMATVTGTSRTIIDFDKQLFTTINVKERQYTQMTFEEMQQRMAELQGEMKDASKGKGADMQIKFDAKATGVEKVVGGFPAKEVIFTIEIGASDGKSSGTMMIMKNDSWHSESVTGYKEYRAFFEQMKDKGSWLNMGQMQSPMGGQKGMIEGMKKMAEEMQKTPGIAVLTISRMTMPGMQMPTMSSGDGQTGGQPSGEAVGDAVKRAGGETAGSAAGRAVGGSMGSVLGGALGGGLGGFGRKKKEAPPAQEPVKEVAAPAPTSNATNSADGALMMESVSDASGFSTESISEEVFAVPVGYAKMDPDFGKRRKK